jgi:hypothetical protein
MQSEICLFRATWRLSTVFLVCSPLTQERYNGLLIVHQFLVLPAMSLRWYSQPASKASEGSYTVVQPMRTNPDLGNPFPIVARKR